MLDDARLGMCRQAEEVAGRFDLARSLRPFTRCMVCNGLLTEVVKAEVEGQAPKRILECFDGFRRCPGCGRVYWEGSHYRRMRLWIEQLAATTQTP